MAFADYSQMLYLHTDACKNGFAAVLTQTRRGRHVLIDAASRTTSPSEKNYESIKLECACIIRAAKKWKHHLYAAPHTIIVTDSYGIQYLQQKKGRQSSLVQRWLCEMEGFQCYVVHSHPYNTLMCSMKSICNLFLYSWLKCSKTTCSTKFINFILYCFTFFFNII